MKAKTLALMFITAVLLVALIVVNFSMGSLEDSVNFSLKTELGDPGILDGMVMDLSSCTSGSDLVWESKLNFSEQGKLETETEFKNGKTDEASRIINRDDHVDDETKHEGYGIEVYDSTMEDLEEYLDLGTGSHDSPGYDVRTAAEKIKEDYEVDHKTRIKLNDYLDHFVLNGWVYKDSSNWKFVRKSMEGTDNSKRFDEYSKFMEFFKIPIGDDIEYMVTKEGSDWYLSDEINIEDGDEYCSNGFSFKTTSKSIGNTVYFSFDNRMDLGGRVDCSLIPGGYGIYAFEIGMDAENSKVPDMSSLRNILRLDENAVVRKLAVSPDGRTLEVFTLEDNDLVLRELDTTGEGSIRESVIWENADREDTYWEPYDINNDRNLLIYSAAELGLEDTSFILAVNKDGFRLLQYTEDGCKVIFSRNFDETDDLKKLGLWLGQASDTKLWWDGERLTLTALKHGLIGNIPITDYNDLMILVYEKEKPVYIGSVKSDLNDELNKRSNDQICEIKEWMTEAEISADINDDYDDGWSDIQLNDLVNKSGVRIDHIKYE